MPKAETKTNLNELIWTRLFWPLLLLIVFAVFLLGYTVLIKPIINQTQTGQALDLKSREKTLQNQKQYLNDLLNLRQNYQRLDQSKIDKLNSMIADKMDLPIILSQINHLTDENQLEIQGISIGAVENGEMQLSLQLKADEYSFFKKFLVALEKNSRVFDIASINISAEDNLYNLELKTYYLE